MHRAADPSRATRVTLAPGVHRPRRPQPCVDPTRLSTHPKQARYSTDYASIRGTNIMRGTPPATSRWLFYHTDHLGSPRVIEEPTRSRGGCAPHDIRPATSRWLFYHTDHLGSPRVIADKDGHLEEP